MLLHHYTETYIYGVIFHKFILGAIKAWYEPIQRWPEEIGMLQKVTSLLHTVLNCCDTKLYTLRGKAYVVGR